MSLLFRIMFAAHGRGTHHKLALHALQRLAGAERDGWQRLFLVNAEAYALGAKKPDDEFKDFKNHVLHPRDGYWGGAVDSARTWYATLVTHLKASAWNEAVMAAGVLSHYLSDPLHPFHTGQSDAENSIHRACEWSINRSYDALYAAGVAASPAAVRRLPRDPNWLARIQCESADLSNAHYERLIAHYDLTRGIADPPTGLDATARKLCSELLVTAAATIAAVLDHAIDEAGVHPPSVNVALPAILATLRIPQNQFLKRFENAAERSAIQAIYDELRATGAVIETLPLENRTIRDLYAAEVSALKPKPDAVKLFPLPAEAVAYTLPAARPKTAAEPRNQIVDTPVTQGAAPQESTTRAAPAIETALAGKTSTERGPRLTTDSDVVDAPSIGPKTAERLNVHGIRTIGDLLRADAAALAKALDQRHIMTSTIRDWQDQTRLVLAVPSLTGTAAQLFIGAGFRTPEALAAADPTSVNAAVLAFVASAEGRRILRDGNVPDAGKIEAWHARARAA
jgi:predicted flap endonuclease-1-like 5' DNA nuclease